jgi:hypothetical protein
MAAGSKVRAAAALAHVMARPGARVAAAAEENDFENGYGDDVRDQVAGGGGTNARNDGGRSPLHGYGGGRSTGGGGVVKDKYFRFALPKVCIYC